MQSFEYYDISPRLWYHPNIAPRKKCYLGSTVTIVIPSMTVIVYISSIICYYFLNPQHVWVSIIWGSCAGFECLHNYPIIPESWYLKHIISRTEDERSLNCNNLNKIDLIGVSQYRNQRVSIPGLKQLYIQNVFWVIKVKCFTVLHNQHSVLPHLPHFRAQFCNISHISVLCVATSLIIQCSVLPSLIRSVLSVATSLIFQRSVLSYLSYFSAQCCHIYHISVLSVAKSVTFQYSVLSHFNAQCCHISHISVVCVATSLII